MIISRLRPNTLPDHHEDRYERASCRAMSNCLCFLQIFQNGGFSYSGQTVVSVSIQTPLMRRFMKFPTFVSGAICLKCTNETMALTEYFARAHTRGLDSTLCQRRFSIQVCCVILSFVFGCTKPRNTKRARGLLFTRY